MNQTGAKYLKNRRIQNLKEETPVLTSTYKPDISIPVRPGVRKRPRYLKRQAE